MVLDAGLRLTGICAGYGDMDVLRDVSVDVPAGSVTAVLGSNGAGKTTLLRVASGALRPRTGSVSVGGEDITTVPRHRRAALGVCHVSEGHNVFPGLTVTENLRLFAARGDEERVLAASLTAFPALRSRLGHRAGTLSGGERQMLALSRAAAAGARVLLLDEVSIGLAPRIADEVVAWIAEAADRGAAVLVVEQHAHRALSIAERVSVLREGRVVHTGSAADLTADDLLARYTGAGLTG